MFRSRSDTEAIIHLYEEYGRGLRPPPAAACSPSPSGTSGDGPAAGARPHRRQAALLRDPPGRACLRLGDQGPARPPRGHSAAATTPPLSPLPDLRRGPAADTLFEGIHKLPAGHHLLLDVDSGAQRLERYWVPRPDPETVARGRRPAEEYVERLEALVRESIGLRMMSDVPVWRVSLGRRRLSANVALMAELADRPVQHVFGRDRGRRGLRRARRGARLARRSAPTTTRW